jgi:uncharacterized protein YqhQ
LARDSAREGEKKERLTFGGMARWGGLDLFGPTYMSAAYRKKGEIFVHVEPSNLWRPDNPMVLRITRLPLIRSFFFWARLLAQVVGSIWTLVFFAGSMAVLWLFVRLMDLGSGMSALGGLFGFFATFPILPLMAVFFASMKLTSIGRYHGAEHKAVAAYEKYGEVTLENARRSSRVHPRCGTNILSYIILAALIDPLIPGWWYAIAQFILISEAWFIFGQTRASIAIGNFLQRYFTTSEPNRSELEVAVESMKQLLKAEQGEHPAGGKALVRVPARY